MTAQSDGQRDAPPLRWVLSDVAAVLIRAVRADDDARLERLFYRLSPESILRHFFVPLPQQPHWAVRLAEVAGADGVKHCALVALVEEEVVGVARYDRTAPELAKFTIVIEDGWQRRGLGKRLMARLVTEAHRQGVETFTAYIQGENRRALRLVAALFATAQPQWYGPECVIQAPTAALRSVSLCGE